MDKKSLIGLGLIAVILITWLSFSGPSKEQIARNKQIKDSIELATKKANAVSEAKVELLQRKQDSLNASMALLNDSAKVALASQKYKDFSTATFGKEETVVLENDVMKAYISTKGAKVIKVELKNYNRYGAKAPLVLFDKDSTNQYLQFQAYGNQQFKTDDFYFTPSEQNIKVSGNETKTVVLKLQTSKSSSFIEFAYTIKGNDYMLGYDVNFVGMQDIIAANQNKITMHWSQAMPSQEKHISKERETATAYYNQVNEGVDYINARRMEEQPLNEDNVKWVSFKQHFFNSSLIADGEFLKDGSFVKTFENASSNEYVKTITAEVGIPFNHKSSENFKMKMYFGPNHYNTLKAYKLDLEDIIPTGWSVFSYINKWMVIPLFNLLSGLNSGIIILILTLVLKTLLFPIAYKTYMSSAKMRVLKPEIDEINAKYEKKDDPMQKQQETMALYRRAGANPLSGCLPMLLQFPILIALFNFFPASIELRQKGFLWADDLSTYDSIYDFGFNVWGYGDHVSLFALLMFASTIIYTWMNQALLQPQQANQMPGMKYMMYLMPVIFLAVMNSYAAGLSWYYFLANIITFLQTWLMRKVIDDGKIREQLLANMKKPEKKSAFQQKLEEMAKQNQQIAKKK